MLEPTIPIMHVCFHGVQSTQDFSHLSSLPASSSLPQLAGAAILGVGIWVKVDSGSILSFLGKIENAPSELSQVLNVGYLLIALGALLLIIGFLGCCGAVKESRCMLLLVRLLHHGGLKEWFHILGKTLTHVLAEKIYTKLHTCTLNLNK